MTDRWTELKTGKEVFDRQAEGWEIDECNDQVHWFPWSSGFWCSGTQYRGRPAQPKKRVVTSECWRNRWDGGLCWFNKGTSPSTQWQRFPCGDRTGEVEE